MRRSFAMSEKGEDVAARKWTQVAATVIGKQISFWESTKCVLGIHLYKYLNFCFATFFQSAV
jgi:hypothetical protein